MRLIRGSGRGARSRRAGAGEEGQSRHAVLTRTVEEEVIPRLLVSRHQRPNLQARPTARPEPTAAHVATLVNLVLTGTQAQATGFVEALHHGGAASHDVLLNVLSPAARRLGVMWEEDVCDFSEVTLGVMRLANVMRVINQEFDDSYEPRAAGPCALLVQMPGEQHGFGLAMVVHFFRRAGWNVAHSPLIQREDLISRVKCQWFSLVGISVACSDRLESLAADIRAIRTASHNPAVGVMVGGPPFIEHPQLAAIVGADTTAFDGLQAVSHANSLVSRLARER